MPLDSGNAMTKQVAVEAERVREEVRSKRGVQAKKVHPLSLCVYPSLQFFLSLYVLTNYPFPQAPYSKKPIMGPLNLPHLASCKRPLIKGRRDVATASGPTPLRAGAPSSKGKGVEGLAQSQSDVRPLTKDKGHLLSAGLEAMKDLHLWQCESSQCTPKPRPLTSWRQMPLPSTSWLKSWPSRGR